MKLRTKLLIAFSATAILAVSIIGLAGLFIGKKSLEADAFSKLTAIRELKANRIEAYFEDIRNHLLSSSENYMFKDAMKDFHKAFHGIKDHRITEAEIDKSLQAYYSKHFIPKLNENSVYEYSMDELYPEDLHTRLLQYHYISENANKNGSKHLLTDSNLDNEYSKVHSKYHSVFRSYLEKFGYYDLFFVDLSGHIVYSVFKEVDFATSLSEDFVRTSNFAKAFRDVKETNREAYVRLIDFEEYSPSYNANASFVATGIFNEGELFGVLVFQLPIDRINDIMTDKREWEKVGLGKSGETYIVAADLSMRNQSRFLIEAKEKYLNKLIEIGVSRDTVDRIDRLNNSIGLQRVNTVGVRAALNGQSGTQIFPDYRGVPVLSSYRPLLIDDVDWIILSEEDKEEAFQAVSEFIRNLALWSLLLLVLIPVLAYFFARTIVKPLDKLTSVSKEMAAGNLNVETGLCRKDEIGTLACSFDTMSESIRQMMDKLEEANSTLEAKVISRTQEIASAHEKIQSIIDNANDAIITIDEQQNILAFNAAAEKTFGYDEKEIIGESLNIILPPKAVTIHHQEVTKFKNEDIISRAMDARREIGGRRKSGEIFPAEASISKQVVEGEYRFTAFVRDISVKKKAEEEVLRQKKLLEDTIESLSYPFYVVDANDYTIKMANSTAKKLGIKGTTTCHALSHRSDTPCNSETDPCPMVEVKKNKKPFQVEHIHFDEHGNQQYVEVHGYPIFDSEGEVVQMIEYSIDITERKKMELAIEEANKRMGDELNVAKDIQMSMLPLIFPAFPRRREIDIFANLIPAREVGGDFYDFYFIDEDRFCFTVGDVSGKGVPGALMMAVTKTLLKSRAGTDESTASILTHVNNEIARENDAYMFITVFIAILDISTGELVYSNAGHNPSFILHGATGELTKLSELHGPVVGAMEEMTFTESRMKLSKGDLVLAYTDGITESQNKDEELYSDKRFVNLLEASMHLGPKELIEKILKDVKEFENGAEQFDDITALAIHMLLDPNSSPGETINLEIRNKLEEINTVVDRFESFGMEQNIPLPVIHKCNIAFDELLNNIISYGYNDDSEHEIQVEIELKSQRLMITIIDDGFPFNPFKKDPPDTKLSIEERNIGGLGIHIVKNLMDEYRYVRNVDKNVITLIKHNINILGNETGN